MYYAYHRSSILIQTDGLRRNGSLVQDTIITMILLYYKPFIKGKKNLKLLIDIVYRLSIKQSYL